MNGNYRQVSRPDWLTHANIANDSEIKLGCLQRIADATEKMASNYDAMREKAEQYERWYNEEKHEKCMRGRTIRALKGVITKLKQQLEAKR